MTVIPSFFRKLKKQLEKLCSTSAGADLPECAELFATSAATQPPPTSGDVITGGTTPTLYNSSHTLTVPAPFDSSLCSAFVEWSQQQHQGGFLGGGGEAGDLSPLDSPLDFSSLGNLSRAELVAACGNTSVFNGEIQYKLCTVF